ncbi:7-cyano-7-deazaguanine synthase 1 [Alloalcanivorax dieselolei B5]|uniref:7-cyano-7-deazaguanine synthase n=1 Tax=Alcanivorax dieselolei (strain DSM 16502 / CGMCC 1.3690 / MCCC 1A00001 / B-5) TaxID=930169 RepID=K0CD19_ALCDB|nr:7-cyano-7-deazaguanine synthase QueC [Alloalcanivorax dieselolei]AFT71489.1 7-cyano-7-deazaguanine synthase 1 [Alloalcanivorax dieselolei B5]GGJ90468.1 7-cyano-7-deazaguanine synthase [Alloalcanivorax dieselolei]
MSTAVVLLSGGLDSATCLAMARAEGHRCHTIAFDYGQRTRSELKAAERVSRALGAESHRVIELGLGNIGGSALTDHDIAVPENVPEEESDGIPVTYVPARNTVFLSLALGLAEVLEADVIYIGVNAVDYSGYPDCRPAFIEAFQNMANLATKAGVEGHPIRIATPLMNLSKADIIREGTRLGLDYGLTVSCYQADEEGQACGRCDSCRLRRQGFEEALVKDPTKYQGA